MGFDRGYIVVVLMAACFCILDLLRLKETKEKEKKEEERKEKEEKREEE